MHSLRPPRFSLRSQPARLDAPAATVPGRAAPSDSVPVLRCWLPCPPYNLTPEAVPLPHSPHRRWLRQACSQAPATLPLPSAPDPYSAEFTPHMPCFASWFAPAASCAVAAADAVQGLVRWRAGPPCRCGPWGELSHPAQHSGRQGAKSESVPGPPCAHRFRSLTSFRASGI